MNAAPPPADALPESACAIADAVRAGEHSAASIVARSLRRIELHDASLNSFREVYANHALAAAQRIDDAIRAGDEPGPLAGVPLAVKDNIVTSFGTSACGSRMLAQYQSPFSATVVERAIAAGAIIIGRTNCDEFGMGSSSEHCAFGAVRNPWDSARVPGGSSGGSAAAVAAGFCPLALGSDTGGSVRQPAALCGVTGLKPSYGRVSRWGLVAFASSLDSIGPIARTADDCALLMEVIAGGDVRDATCLDRHVPSYRAELDAPINGVRIGVPKQCLGAANSPAVNAAVREAIERLRSLGATIIEINLPRSAYSVATYYVIAPAEASSNLARFDGIRYGHRAERSASDSLEEFYARSRAEGFGPEVQRRIMLGTFALSAGYHDAYYQRASQARRLIQRELATAFEDCDVIVGPTSPVPAFPLGEQLDLLQMYMLDVYTTVASIAGCCAISIPCGFANAGGAAEGGTQLPIGLQFQCPAFEEARLLRIAHLAQQQMTEALRWPPGAMIESRT